LSRNYVQEQSLKNFILLSVTKESAWDWHFCLFENRTRYDVKPPVTVLQWLTDESNLKNKLQNQSSDELCHLIRYETCERSHKESTTSCDLTSL